MKSSLVIAPRPGFTPQVGRLVAYLDYARTLTLRLVSDLTTFRLDYVAEPGGNSTGLLLSHLAALERACQIEMIEAREVEEEDLLEWAGALPMDGRRASRYRGRDAAHYIELLQIVRRSTLTGLAAVDDEWLERRRTHASGYSLNNHFMWLHLLEEEFYHRGQMAWLRKWSASDG